MMEENGKSFDCWHLEAQTDEEAVAALEEKAALLAGGPQARYVEGPAQYPPPCRTPARLLAMPRCKLSGRLLDREPEIPGETEEAARDRVKRNMKAMVADRQVFESTPRWPKLQQQRINQLVVDLQYPPGTGEPEWLVRVAGRGGESFTPLIVPGAHAHEAEQRYLKIMGIRGFDHADGVYNPHVEAVLYTSPSTTGHITNLEGEDHAQTQSE